MSQKSFFFLLLLCCLITKSIAQEQYAISLIDKNLDPIPFAIAVTKDTIVFSNTSGEIHFNKQAKNINIYAAGFKPKKLKYFQLQSILEKTNAKEVYPEDELLQFSNNSSQNNPYINLSMIYCKRYNKTLIRRDSVNYKTKNENLFSERISELYIENNQEKERIVAQKDQGFSEPILKLLSHRMHGLNWYNKFYTIFETEYASPLHSQNFYAYTYQLIHKDEKNIFLQFSPKLQFAERLLQGVICLDNNYALQKIYVNKDDDIKLDLVQSFFKQKYTDFWFPKEVQVNMTPGKGGKAVSLFGTNINIGTLQDKSITNSDQNNQLISKSIYHDFSFNKQNFDTKKYDILVDKQAYLRSDDFWKENRKITIDKKDSLFFEGTEQTLKRKKTISKIRKLQNFNKGFFPILNWKTDLKTLIKINNYEGLRLGIGGLTNEDFSDYFKIGGYIAYGTKDRTVKYGIQSGLLLHRDTNMWLNASYTDDVREVSSNTYLTDQRVYSLFEPRLVNIIFFYKEKTTSLSIQRKLSPSLLSELKIGHDRIFQTENYAFINGDITLQSYDLTRALLSLRWSPRSRFLKFDNNFVNLKENYPVISGQIEQYFGSVFGGDLNFTKLSIKSDYIIHHINNQKTEFAVEGNIAFGDVPLTHTFHAFPNAPNKSTVLDRFSVAGVKSFETMFFSEFFSTKMASLHIKHMLSPFKISNTIRPEMVFISRHAIGDFSNQNRHVGIHFNTLNKGFSETGIELNKIFWGFGLSFAYRYGAYHLPKFEDNIAFKFTFNLKL